MRSLNFFKKNVRISTIRTNLTELKKEGKVENGSANNIPIGSWRAIKKWRYIEDGSIDPLILLIYNAYLQKIEFVYHNLKYKLILKKIIPSQTITDSKSLLTITFKPHRKKQETIVLIEYGKNHIHKPIVQKDYGQFLQKICDTLNATGIRNTTPDQLILTNYSIGKDLQIGIDIVDNPQLMDFERILLPEQDYGYYIEIYYYSQDDIRYIRVAVDVQKKSLFLLETNAESRDLPINKFPKLYNPFETHVKINLLLEIIKKIEQEIKQLKDITHKGFQIQDHLIILENCLKSHAELLDKLQNEYEEISKKQNETLESVVNLQYSLTQKIDEAIGLIQELQKTLESQILDVKISIDLIQADLDRFKSKLDTLCENINTLKQNIGNIFKELNKIFTKCSDIFNFLKEKDNHDKELSEKIFKRLNFAIIIICGLILFLAFYRR